MLTVLATDTTSPSSWFVVSNVTVIILEKHWSPTRASSKKEHIHCAGHETTSIIKIRNHEYTTNEDCQQVVDQVTP